MPFDTTNDVLSQPHVVEAIRRGIIAIVDDRVTYRLNQQRSYSWTDPEEWVRAHTISWLVIERDYPVGRLRTEVNVPRRTPNDFADIVVYTDDQCRAPYLVVENKAFGQTDLQRRQWIEQTFGNANSLRAPFAMYDEGNISILFDLANHPSSERQANRLGERTSLPRQYGEAPAYSYIAGQPGDIAPVDTPVLSSRIRRAHFIIWAGGRRDPLLAFDEWSKLLFAKVIDERTTPTGQPRRFQVGTRETTAAVANRIHALFSEAKRVDAAIFPPGIGINLPETKIAQVVETLQAISFTRTEVDTIGRAFEEFFGSVFRGELGQYFTMRQLARFTVALADIGPTDYVLDPTAGSGGFLLEALLQTWHRIDREYAGQPEAICERLKTDFALAHVYGIEIHEILARICKINLLLHHDGHTNIEADRSCLDTMFLNPRLNNPNSRFSRIVGNPPFGDEVKENDEDHLGSNTLDSFRIAGGRRKVDSEQVILERCIQFLEPEGVLGLVLPDGLLNNQGVLSNCPQSRMLLASSGRIEAIVSLPDYAFRKAGAQNKTSILFFRKFSEQEQRAFDRALVEARAAQGGEQHDNDRENQIIASPLVSEALVRSNLDYVTFLAEASSVGYTTTGALSPHNDLYRPGHNGSLHDDQSNTILGEWRSFSLAPAQYQGRVIPDCMGIRFSTLWNAHSSHRLDPKYHLFEREEHRSAPGGWVQVRIGEILTRREEPKADFQSDSVYTVLTISQTGELRAREAGKGNNPSSWTGDYFLEVSPGDWFEAMAGDVVFSSIDLWKGCIAVVPSEFDRGLVTKEFPIYQVADSRITSEFLQTLLRSRYYQRAFRAITTGHSNRRRTQVIDFENVLISFPPDPEQQRDLIQGISTARRNQATAKASLLQELLKLSDQIDGRGEEELPTINEPENIDERG
jgi:type I restriction enzyme M protein